MNEQRDRLIYKAYQSLTNYVHDDNQTLQKASIFFLRDAYKAIDKERENDYSSKNTGPYLLSLH